MTDRMNTIFGWLLFAGIVALGLSIVSGMYFHADDPERPETMAYSVEVAAEGGDGPVIPIANFLAEGDAAAGAKVFAKCQACHTINQGGPNGIGPNLYGVMGAAIGGHAPGFAYSSALQEKGGSWTYDEMNAWLENPKAYAPGTKMSFAGLGNPEDRANLMLYLVENGGGPPLPEPVEIVEEGAVEGETDGAGEGPGVTEGEPVGDIEAAGAMGDEQPVPSQGSAAEN
ncbi:c-type cytochrome [Altererythrobacter aurantiacus]|uniref:C-type cytochrome n=2 Tax=Parapontixanthobacter aurantiacus TaxID=1463599 RepID=A0A844ZHJ8_9SPHN|nr:cytochrome c family protein [Parapontixanthobacter aurantiacus]MXO86440.1 c-type cytochrome [Parapontixanthobacter aurantiacus]